MLRVVQIVVLSVVVLSGVRASAFSLLGPFAQDTSGTVWQVPRIGYSLAGDIGGPMNLTEEYRWNVKTITYGFDPTFIAYFGARGVQEINKAIAILNALPPASKMSAVLSEFPTDTRRINEEARSLNLIDLKSAALGFLLEEMGLAAPERYVWALRSRVILPNNVATNYAVIMRNFDPVTFEPSAYVNGTLYTYQVIDAYWNETSSDAVEEAVDPLAPINTAVAGYSENGVVPGQYFIGLTRDDVGGLKYLLRRGNVNREGLLPGTLPTAGGPWTPVIPGTNGIATNLLVDVAYRPGVDKIVFKWIRNQTGGIGLLPGVTNRYSDQYFDASGKLRTQKVQRSLNFTNDVGVPDILFTAGDLGVNAISGLPVLIRRTDTTFWINNAALNTQSGDSAAGPGVIRPPITISFSNVGPYRFNQFPGFMDEVSSLVGLVWGSFDGTTNTPVVYPNTRSIQELEDRLLEGAF